MPLFYSIFNQIATYATGLLAGTIKGKGMLTLNVACVNINSTFDKDFSGTLTPALATSTISYPVGAKGVLALGAFSYSLTNGGTIHRLIANGAGTLVTAANLIIDELDLTNAAFTLVPAFGTTITIKSILAGSDQVLTLGNNTSISGSVIIKAGSTSGGIAYGTSGITSLVVA